MLVTSLLLAPWLASIPLQDPAPARLEVNPVEIALPGGATRVRGLTSCLNSVSNVA